MRFYTSSFNGKERDPESGFHYYGARYYWSETLTGWLSVDPLADKYPNISPYAYCAWNPVKLVDPDGKDTTVGIDLVTGNVDYQVSLESYNGTIVNINHEGQQITSIIIQGQISYSEKGISTDLSFSDYSDALLVYRNLIGGENGGMTSCVEWNYYRQRNNEGGLVTSHKSDAINLTLFKDKYNKSETSMWRHFHPKIPNYAWFVPSEQDQQYAIDMGFIPCYLDFTGQSYRFDDIVQREGIQSTSNFKIPIIINQY